MNVKTKTPLSKEAHKVIFTLVITLAIFIVVLAVILIATSSKSSQQGYVLKQAQIENDKLRIEGEELKTKIVKTQSFQEIKGTDKVSEMREIETREYVTPKNQ